MWGPTILSKEFPEGIQQLVSVFQVMKSCKAWLQIFITFLRLRTKKKKKKKKNQKHFQVENFLPQTLCTQAYTYTASSCFLSKQPTCFTQTYNSLLLVLSIIPVHLHGLISSTVIGSLLSTGSSFPAITAVVSLVQLSRFQLVQLWQNLLQEAWALWWECLWSGVDTIVVEENVGEQAGIRKKNKQINEH